MPGSLADQNQQDAHMHGIPARPADASVDCGCSCSSGDQVQLGLLVEDGLGDPGLLLFLVLVPAPPTPTAIIVVSGVVDANRTWMDRIDHVGLLAGARIPTLPVAILAPSALIARSRHGYIARATFALDISTRVPDS